MDFTPPTLLALADFPTQTAALRGFGEGSMIQT